MNPAALGHGTYEAELRITHNDTTKASPQVYPISFIVAPCPCEGDPKCDSATDVLDVVRVIERAFRGTAATLDSTCSPYGTAVDGRTDVDCTGATDVLDVVKMIDVAFRGVDRSARFCKPCG